MTEIDQPPPSTPEAGRTQAEAPGGDGSGSTVRIAGLIALLVVVAAAALIVTLGGDEPKQKSNTVITPFPPDLAKAGYVKQSDGRFAPEDFGMAFDYPDGFFEMLSPAGETSRDDETLGISERRRHFLFSSSAEQAANAATAQPAFRVIRVSYAKAYDASTLSEFRDELASQPGAKPSAVREIAGVPAFVRDLEAPGGSGETTYFAVHGKFFQLLSFAAPEDRKTVQLARDQIIETLSFSE